MSERERLSSRLEFRPLPHVDPVPWPYLIEILEQRHILEIARVQVQLHKEVLQAQLRATEAIEKTLGGIRAPKG
jgi:hypothetical protein